MLNTTGLDIGVLGKPQTRALGEPYIDAAGELQIGAKDEPHIGVPGELKISAPNDPLLVLATHNAGKVKELREILRTQPGLADLPDSAIASSADFDLTAPAEDGATFAENALIKARVVCQATGLPAVADDSGLSVDIMGGAPGIFSARWCGHHGDDAANLNLLLGQLAENPDPAHRKAAFICAAALVLPDGREFVELGQMRGTLLTEARGTGGFGYDPIFVPDDAMHSTHDEAVAPRSKNPKDAVTSGPTTAELSPAQKNAISHRGRAFRQLAPLITRAIASNVG